MIALRIWWADKGELYADLATYYMLCAFTGFASGFGWMYLP